MTLSKVRASVLVACVVLTSLLLASSCRQLARVDQHAACEDVEAPRVGCTVCQRAECCDEALACGADAACRELDECIAKSSSDLDRTECGGKHAPGLRGPFAALASCRARACPDECRGACGDFVYRDAECAACSEKQCCDAARACSASAECLALSYCERACNAHDVACLGDCERRHPRGPEAQALISCTAASCATECNLVAVEPDWTCIGKPSSPPDPVPQVTVTVDVQKFDASGSAKLQHASVKLCKKEICLQEGWTDKNGQFAFFPFVPGFMGWVEVESESSEIVKTYAYYNSPLFHDATLSVLGFTTDGFKTFFAPLGADPAKGHVTLRAVDCSVQGNDAAGVSFSLVEQCDPVCGAGGFEAYYGFSADNPGTATIPGNGNGGFINVPPGTYDAVVRRRDTGECVATQTIIVYAGARTSVEPIFPGGCKQ